MMRIERCHRHLLLMVALFAASQFACHLWGIKFDMGPLRVFWQYLDVELLRHRLAESLLYLHSQPPLFNLFLGLVLKLFPGREGVAFHCCYAGLGLVLYVALFKIMRRLGVSAAISLVLSTLFMISPSFVLYEHWLFYTFPVAAVLTLSALVFYDMLRCPAPWKAFAFFSLLFLLCATRSVFHLAYFLLVSGGLVILRREQRRLFFTAALVPFLLLASLYAKNLVLFGKFTASSWVGMNVKKVTVDILRQPERDRLVAEGKLSPLAPLRAFPRLHDCPEEYSRVAGFENVPALRDAIKSTGGPNFNHLAYIAISDQSLADALYVGAHRPKILLIGWLNAWLRYFCSATHYAFLESNRETIEPLSSIYDYLFYGKLGSYVLHSREIPIYRGHIYVFLIAGLPLLLCHGLRCTFRGELTCRALAPEQRLLILYICFNIVFIAVAGNSIDVGENQRFRFLTDPLYVALLGLALESYWPRSLWRRNLRKRGLQGRDT